MFQFSIIIPIYNAEKYLKRCLNSLCIEKHSDVQVILVNDGSTDFSESICFEYKNTYPQQVVYLEKKNAGVSAARNDAIAVAMGKYLLFIDADDYVVDNYIEEIKKIVETQADLYLFNYIISESTQLIYRKSFTEEGLYKINAQFCEDIFERFEYQIWNKIFLNKIIKDHHIQFKANMKWSEDLDFWTRYAVYTDSVLMCPKHLYYYWQNENGAVSSINKKAFENYHIAYISQYELLKSKKAKKRSYRLLAQSYVEIVGLLISNCFQNGNTLPELRNILNITKTIQDMDYIPLSLSAKFKRHCIRHGFLRILVSYYKLRALTVKTRRNCE